MHGLLHPFTLSKEARRESCTRTHHFTTSAVPDHDGPDVRQLRDCRDGMGFLGKRYGTTEQVIRQYSSRWSIEVAYRDVKQCLGFEQPQGWCRKTVERTAPMAMLIYSLVIIWFAREGHRHWRPERHARYRSRRDPSFADMLAELKRRSFRGYITALPLNSLGPRKLFSILENTLNWQRNLQKSNSPPSTRSSSTPLSAGSMSPATSPSLRWISNLAAAPIWRPTPPTPGSKH